MDLQNRKNRSREVPSLALNLPQSEVEVAWIDKFGSARPGALWLGDGGLGTRHLRIHSLPMSKRYAHSEEEREEILRRHELIAAELLGKGSKCVAFYCCRHGFDELERLASLSCLDLPYLKRDSLGYGEGEDRYEVFSAPIIWSSRSKDKLLMAIADNEFRKITFANLERGSIYEPYDGGADLVFSSEQSMLAAREAWTHWQSFREDGR